MDLLKQHLRTTSYQSDLATTFTALLRKLQELHIVVEKEERDKGEIVARCPGVCVNTILWRCWSDKILLEVRKIEDNSTRVSIYAIPNLFRVAARKGETVTDLNELVSQLTA